ncbi:tyrosine-type recombinase/integrase [Limnohabitans sp. 63ED37-2]|uniref:tyrosine-type recombinase/integrase n=1 Tax=Limnohabitans sp. 63ED37-2 TaxID=1678128 RepID=UPI0007064A2B|nr:tyrosine-type recombinase/integrase [Limnohabitans sp. 63ED37-2]ALK90336.1 site-specific tyrosine recombinase XerC [Limnohabitans sp. 63ED37-2]
MQQPPHSTLYLEAERHADGKKSAFQKTTLRSTLTALHAAQPQSIYLRDGELVLYRRSRSLLYQCRYRLADGSWVRQTTGKAALEHAIARACDIYDEARYRQRLGLAHRTHSVAQIAAVCCAALRQQIDGKGKKTALNDYLSIIERYFVPYFGERQLETLTHTDVREFELWRDRQMTRKPKTSTLNNFTSAWSRLVATAVEQGYISERVPVPKLTSKGEKGKTRPAFSKEEIEQLLEFVETWQHKGKFAVEHEIRPLLRDYIEMLLYTGMRHGTEAMGIRWRDLEWHTKDGVRYLRVWVDGKTGGRWLIAKHKAVDVLRRLHARQKDIASVPFEDVLTTRVPHLLFRFSDGHQPHSLVGTFRKLMRDSGLLVDGAGQTRTLYSLRHTYATLALLEGGADIHTLSKQMGNSAAMIERHYSKLTATMAADRLA